MAGRRGGGNTVRWWRRARGEERGARRGRSGEAEVGRTELFVVTLSMGCTITSRWLPRSPTNCCAGESDKAESTSNELKICLMLGGQAEAGNVPRLSHADEVVLEEHRPTRTAPTRTRVKVTAASSRRRRRSYVAAGVNRLPGTVQRSVVDRHHTGRCDEENDAEDDRAGGTDQRLRGQLVPREGDPRRIDLLNGVLDAVLGVPHVGQHDVLQADLLDCPGGILDWSVVRHEQGALAIGVARLDDLLVGREALPGPGAARRAGGGEASRSSTSPDHLRAAKPRARSGSRRPARGRRPGARRG